ncbi:HepT-like ribonuclease domain-containing protein [Pseudobutyrivibrio xylanivorans]|uniref:Uncharacterized conserved protein, contains HEPN domain n=1 Tax=Pseudobutyrivibrio xylanivorans TaxID=185007 RepID=A0A1G5S4R4_PSEXY|nr:HepT-like ribonuclease domain-containing protein [Pseudobutyrivibrio xylanivorans]SCZ81168.1 Uncharacterized conserved protein, contains HEPN domain [Pseudobutyrivibrio xylanivorans]
MKYSDEQRIKKIYENAKKLDEYIKSNNIQKDQLLQEQTLQWLVTTPLYNIGENAYYLSDDYKNKTPEIPWKMISGLRHRLVHDYDGINWTIIADVVLEEIPDLIEQLKYLV